MNPLRLTLVTHYFSTHRGGVEQAAGHLAARLVQTGRFEIEWFASDCDVPPVMDERVITRPMRSWNKLERLSLPWPLWGFSALKSLRRSICTCDIVHIHDFIYFGNIVAFVLARWYQKPLVITQHIGDASYLTRRKALFLNALNRTLGRFILARAQQVIFISDEVRRQFSNHIRFINPPLLWPNALDIDIFYPATQQQRQTIRKQHNVVESKPVLLFVGRFIERKGLGILHQLAEAMPNADWWFAGWGQRQSPLHPTNWGLPNVRLFEDLHGEQLADLYRATDLLVLPSHSEGFPLVVQEAMACGTSALVSTETAIGAPSATQWLYTCKLSPLHSACERWKAALLEILGNSALSARRDAVAQFAQAEWTWEHCVARYAELFERLTLPADQSSTPALPH